MYSSRSATERSDLGGLVTVVKGRKGEGMRIPLAADGGVLERAVARLLLGHPSLDLGDGRLMEFVDDVERELFIAVGHTGRG